MNVILLARLYPQKVPYSFPGFGWDASHLTVDVYRVDTVIWICLSRLTDGREGRVLCSVI